MRGGLDNVLPTYLACRIRNEDYIFEVTENCLFENRNDCSKQIEYLRNVKRNIVKNAKRVVVHGDEVYKNVVKWGVLEKKIIKINRDEVINISNFIL